MNPSAHRDGAVALAQLGGRHGEVGLAGRGDLIALVGLEIGRRGDQATRATRLQDVRDNW